jgi:hypothetical protein
MNRTIVRFILPPLALPVSSKWERPVASEGRSLALQACDDLIYRSYIILMATILKPPSPLPAASSLPRVFLAGSIEMGTASDWQTRVADALRAFEVLILNPRRNAWDASWEQTIRNPQFREQVEWELAAQETADVIAMYFAPETKAPITLLELGLFAASGKLLVCCPDGYWRKGNVEIVCARYNIPLKASFDDLIDELRRRFGA